jgi:hypothetical protein
MDGAGRGVARTGRGGKSSKGAAAAAAAALAEAQSLLLHQRLDEAVATALTALGAPPASAAAAWEDVIDELPPCAPVKAAKPEVVQLSCIAVQGANRLGKLESAAAIAGRLFASQGADAGAVAAAAAAPVEVALSLAHGLDAAGQRDEAEKAVRARLTAYAAAWSGAKGDGSDSPSASPSKSARSDGALLTEYLLFHLLCPPTTPGTALADPAKRTKAVEGARKFLKGKGSPKLPKPVKDAFVIRLDALAEEAVAATKAAKEEEKRRTRAAAAVSASAAAPAAATAAPATPSATSGGGGGGERRSTRKKERSIGREVQPAYEPPPPSFAVRLLRAILTVKGIGTIGVVAVLSYLLSKSALGRWLYEQLDGMWQLATSVRM